VDYITGLKTRGVGFDSVLSENWNCCVHAMKACVGNRGIAPLILNNSTKWK